jgi:aspartate carbamoyltransferase catalytic subunit
MATRKIKVFFGMHHLLSVDDLSFSDVENIMDLSFSMLEILGRDIKKVPTLRGRTVFLMFFEPSTRTRVSFELAAKTLSADTINLSDKGSSIEKGESLADTIKTIKSLGADFIVVRHKGEGFPHLIADLAKIPTINGGDGKNEHPTQALLDLLTMMLKKGVRKLSEIKGATISIVGDIMHSRVARSGIKLFSKVGLNVIVVSSYTTLPKDIEKFFGVKVKNFFDDEVFSSDFIMALRLQKERHGNFIIPSDREYNEFWGLNQRFLDEIKRRKKDSVIIMHPGPMNLGVEIEPSVAYSDSSAIFEQVRNGVAVRMAVFYYLFTKNTKRETS